MREKPLLKSRTFSVALLTKETKRTFSVSFSYVAINAEFAHLDCWSVQTLANISWLVDGDTSSFVELTALLISLFIGCGNSVHLPWSLKKKSSHVDGLKIKKETMQDFHFFRFSN